MDLQLLWSSGSTGFTKLWWQALQKSKIHCGDLDLCCLHNTATCKLCLHCYTHAPANKKFRPVIKTKMCLLQWWNTRPIVYPPRRGQNSEISFSKHDNPSLFFSIGRTSHVEKHGRRCGLHFTFGWEFRWLMDVEWAPCLFVIRVRWKSCRNTTFVHDKSLEKARKFIGGRQRSVPRFSAAAMKVFHVICNFKRGNVCHFQTFSTHFYIDMPLNVNQIQFNRKPNRNDEYLQKVFRANARKWPQIWAVTSKCLH